MHTRFIQICTITCLMWLLSACGQQQPTIIIITATSPAGIQPDTAENATNIITEPTSTPIVVVSTATPVQPASVSLSPAPQQPLSNPTPNATAQPAEIPSSHVVQPGDTLSGIASSYGVNLDTLLSVNELLDPNLLEVGQVVNLPAIPEQFTPNFKILPDSRLVRAPGSASFDVASFIAQQPGYIRVATDTVDSTLDNGARFPQITSSAEIVERVALEYSVDPRLLLAILEFRAGYLSNPQPAEFLQTRPLVTQATAPSVEGLYDQLSWAANELNRAYYGWKYRGLITLTFNDGTSQRFNPELNPATIAVQYLLSRDDTPPAVWQNEVGVGGLYSVYVQYFGDPFTNPVEPLVPAN
ncbi:MAG: LysM peptidoglycan-binding domain-containing protein, partial [Chloroflexota bacterium]